MSWRDTLGMNHAPEELPTHNTQYTHKCPDPVNSADCADSAFRQAGRKPPAKVDVEALLTELAVGLPVDVDWLKSFFTADDLALISTGEYLTGDLDQYRAALRTISAPREAVRCT